MKLLFTVLLSVLVLSCTNNKTYNISEFHLNGHKKVVNIFEDDKLITKISYNEEGDMISRVEYYLNVASGIWAQKQSNSKSSVDYYGNGNKRSESRAINSLLQGRKSYFNRQGHIEKEKYFNKGRPTGCWVEYNHDSNIKLIQDYGLNKGNGIWTEYFQNGNIMKKSRYLDNQLHGNFIEFYRNGIIKKNGTYSMGKKTNEWNEYNNQGILIKIENYSEGLLSGLWKLFHSTSDVKMVGQYKDNYRQGNWKWHNKDGDLIHSKQY